MVWRGLVLGVGILWCSVPLSGQQRAASIRGPASSILFSAGIERTPVMSTDSAAGILPATQWKRGLFLGGAIGAVGLGASVFALCQGLRESNESCLGPGVAGATLGAVVGSTVGALIGGQIHQRSSIPANSAGR
jgi:hypothetical protein